MKRISYLLISLLLVMPAAEAREWFEFYNNARTNAMGGTKIAVTSDDTSVFRNPANLGSFRGAYATGLDPELEVSESFLSAFGTTTTDVAKVKDLLLLNRDKHYHSKLQLTPSVSMRNFGFGLIYKNEISAIMNTAGTTMDTMYRSDLGAVLGFNYSFFDGRIKFGLSGRMINRIEVDNVVLDPTASLDLATIGAEGTGFGGDVGIILQAPVIYLPTLAVVAHDLGGSKFTSSSGMRLTTANRPQEVKQSVDVGISIQPIHDKGARSVFSIEYSDITDSRLEAFQAKRIHAGFEYGWNDIFYVRAGINQNYWTAGLEIASERVSWQITTYGEEVGTVTSSREDRRYNTRIAVRF